MVSLPANISPGFEVLRPREQTAPLVLDSPHSGRNYTDEFLASSRLNNMQLRRSEDAFVDQLFDFAPEIGLPLLRAIFPRAYLDVNRDYNEIDPAMFDALPDWELNSRSLRVAAGLGTIPRVVGENQAIYDAKLPLSEVYNRIDGLYRPYHRELTNLLDETHRQFGRYVLLDCHSMPSQPFTTPVPGHSRADIVLGDRFGTSCAPDIVDVIQADLQKAGLKVQRNKPYAGAFITEFYGHPNENGNALQIEINRDLYMNEKTFEKRDSFASLRSLLRHCTETLISYLAQHPHLRDAAE